MHIEYNIDIVIYLFKQPWTFSRNANDKLALCFTSRKAASPSSGGCTRGFVVEIEKIICHEKNIFQDLSWSTGKIQFRQPSGL